MTLAEAPSEQFPQTWIKDVRILEKEKKYGELIKNVISDLELKGTKVGLGDHVWGSTTVKIAKIVKGAKFYKAEALMDHLRMIKGLDEIERLRRVAKLTDRVMEATVSHIKKGVTQRELEVEVELQAKMMEHQMSLFRQQ